MIEAAYHASLESGGYRREPEIAPNRRGPESQPPSGRLVLISHDGPTGDGEPDYRGASIDFRQLSYFISVAEELHFGRAAARMFISQPALSQAIAGLERALGVQLLERSRQSVELTGAGAELLDRARGLLADREEAVDAVRRIGRGDAGVLRVGVALFADQEIGGLLAAFAGEHPGIAMDRFTAVSERLLASLQDHGMHVALVHAVPVLTTLDGVDWEVLQQASLAVLVSADSPLADLESVELSKLSGETFLVNPRELAPSAFEGLSTMCRTYGGFDPKVLESSTLALGHDWQPVVDGDAAALMPESTALALHPEGTAVVRVEEPSATLAVAWRDGSRSPVLERFLDFARAYRKEHAWAEGAPETV